MVAPEEVRHMAATEHPPAPASHDVPDCVPSGRAAEGCIDVLPRTLGTWSMISVTMGVMIGSGIFRTPSSIAQMTGSVGGLSLIWVVGGIVTLCLALCLAELSTMFPRAGGIYTYLHEAYGPVVAFVFGWTFLIINPAQWAAITIIFADYLSAFVPLTTDGKRLVASALIVCVSAANYYSLRFASAIQNFATVSKALALAVISVLLFALADGSGGALAQPAQWSLPGFSSIAVAIVAVLWPYEGVASSCALAGEVRDPARTLPRALIAGVLGVTALYLLINAAYVYVLPFDVVAGSGFVAAEAMRRVAGTAGAAFISACVLLSTFGAIAATSMVDPRVFYAMARDGLFFKRIGAVHPRYRTPHVAIVVSAALAIVYLWIRTFEQLAAQFILGLWVFYALAVFAVLVLRIRRPDAARPYRTLGYPVVPLVFVLCAAGLLVSAFIELPVISFVNLGVTASGILFYFIWKLRAGRQAAVIRASNL